ncbi:hypothetical protein, partial [Ralstonia pseudosolanacearum]|uniref:hypothetical protein n=1 Tax=Ralstonia pseudosolanacearum TaxID=1310165 RepID=UPI001FF8CF96
SASAAKAAILSQVGQVYFGGWVSFTSALTASRERQIQYPAAASAQGAAIDSERRVSTKTMRS